MKKCYSRYCAGPAYYRMCSTDVYCSNKPAAVAPKENPSPIISSFLNWAEETVDAAKICGGAENVVKTETQQTFVNGLLGFITLGNFYTPLALLRVLSLLLVYELPIDMGNSICTTTMVLLGSFQLFWHSDQPLRVK